MQTRTVIRRSAAGAPAVPARPPENKRYTAVLRIASLVILVVFMAGGLLSGYLFYETVRMVVASVPLNPVQEVPAAAPVAGRSSQPASSNPGTAGTGAQPASVSNPQPKPPAFSLGNERVNILLMGVDSRPGKRTRRAPM